MNQFETIVVSKNNGIAELVLNRAQKHNAINALMISELRQAAADISADETIRVVVLSATGKSFCAGGDLNWMKQQATNNRAKKITQSSELAKMLRDLDELPKPVIGKIHGSAYGGGIGLISVCDIAIGLNSARFALTETRLGLIPATIGPYVVRRIGEANARQVFMNGMRFNAETACRFGLLSKSVTEAELDETVNSEVNAFLECAPGAVADAKSLCLTLARHPHENQLEMTSNRLADRWESLEAQSGINAFFAGTKAPWIK